MATVLRNPFGFAVALAVLAAGILIPLTRWSVRRDRDDTMALSGAASLVGGSFIFISAFVVVTVWQGERQHEGLIVKEFAAAGNLAEDVVWYMKAGDLDAGTGNRLLDELHAYGQAVRDDELTQVTGLPALPATQGSVRANDALREVGNILDEYAAKARIPDDSSLWDWWRDLSNTRVERLSLRAPLPDALFAVMLVSAVAELVLIGVYPRGDDVAVRWIVSALSGVVVVTVLVAVVMLINPQNKQAARQGPVDALNAVIATRP